MTKDFTYFPFLRTGLSSAVTTPDTAAADPFVKLSVRAVVDAVAAPPVNLRLAGPGEVIGLDSRAVVRADPAPGAMGVPPNLFAAIELKPADLPWMFTPLGPSGDLLRPWVCLVVTDFEDTGEPVVDASRPLPLLHVEHPDRVLPDPKEAWAWAHVAVAGETDASGLQTAIGAGSQQVVARLLCPRRLSPERRYVAALVPLFKGGRVAGLGGDVSDTDKVTDAWSVASGAAAVDLPVYHSWTFTTGVGGDFRSLALRLEGRQPPAGAGSRPMDVTDPGGGLPTLPSTATTKTLGLEGALQPDGFSPTPWDSKEAAAFEKKISQLVDDANTAPAATLGPPLWGRWQAAQSTFPASTPAWLRELNADPRHRAAAGLGARIVHEQREQLMAHAWEQVGEVQKANQLLRQAQLARAHGKSLYERALPAASDGTFLLLTRPLHDRVLVDKRRTAFGEVRASSLPERLLDGAFRRVARPRGPLSRRLGRNTGDPGELVEKAAGGAIAAAGPALPPRGSGQIVANVERLSPTALGARPSTTTFTPLIDWQTAPTAAREPGPDSPLMTMFRQAITDYESWRSDLRRRPVDTPPDLDPGKLRQRVMAGIDPDTTVRRRIRALVTAPAWSGAGDPLEPIMAAPTFPQPMCLPLLAISQELVLPGLGDIPADTVTAAAPNTRFIESYMVGLNHEMSRELLFNEYPTDLRGTYFRQFWDVRGRVPAPAPGTTDDIAPIDGWPTGNVLGADVTGGGSGLLVVIVRGELLRRYPEAAIYAAPAKWVMPWPDPTLPKPDSIPRRELDTSASPKFPVMRGRLEPDLVYFGFALTADDAAGERDPASPSDAPGWFFVFEQNPIEPHYGLADAPASGTTGTSPASWDRVSWGDVTPAPPDPQKPRAGLFAPAAKPSWWTLTTPAGQPAWGASSAAMAAICLERPTRLALHASDLLAP